jgi:hypothetical protein
MLERATGSDIGAAGETAANENKAAEESTKSKTAKTPDQQKNRRRGS